MCAFTLHTSRGVRERTAKNIEDDTPDDDDNDMH